MARTLLAFLLALFSACADSPPPVSPCPRALPSPIEPVELIAEPWAQVVGPGVARLRFETTTHAVVPVLVDTGGPCPTERAPSRSSSTVAFSFPPGGSLVHPRPDRPGHRVLHDTRFEALAPGSLAPGSVVRWTVDTGGGTVRSGTFHMPPAVGTPFRFAFTGDTSPPDRDDVMRLASDAHPDVFLHGGDIQYQVNPLDTWSSMFADAAPVTRIALFQPVPGNHEYEDMDEFSTMYVRYFGGYESPGATPSWYSFDYAGVRFVGLDSERGLGDATSPQVAFLEDRLREVEADPELMFAVVWFHRPLWTLGRHGPRTDIRAVLHPMFVRHGVPLVLTAHNHSYERFEVDGVTYVVDGGGGAHLYDVDAHAADLPEDAPFRQAKSGTHGVTIVDVGAGGALQLARTDLAGREVDSLAIRPAPATPVSEPKP